MEDCWTVGVVLGIRVKIVMTTEMLVVEHLLVIILSYCCVTRYHSAQTYGSPLTTSLILDIFSEVLSLSVD